MKPFADRLLAWWNVHGRRELPWQHPRTPYRVWVSEIMLQQTRVDTATDYFNRFMQRFPDLETLANASADDVLSLWSGLGYYARARNLHAAAIVIKEDYDCQLPCDYDQLHALPGIGRSTAAAILAQGFGQRATILDGNVKRVLARHAEVEGWPGKTAVANELWHQAELRTPHSHAADYTQAIMDLGATVCSRNKPVCKQCPVSADCEALINNRQHELPTPKPRKIIPTRSQRFAILRNQADEVLMIRRPPSGVWGGLWCLPESDEINYRVLQKRSVPATFQHTFSHFKLDMQFEHAQIQTQSMVCEQPTCWLSISDWLKSGIPRPIRQVLEGIESHETSAEQLN